MGYSARESVCDFKIEQAGFLAIVPVITQECLEKSDSKGARTLYF